MKNPREPLPDAQTLLLDGIVGGLRKVEWTRAERCGSAQALTRQRTEEPPTMSSVSDHPTQGAGACTYEAQSRCCLSSGCIRANGSVQLLQTMPLFLAGRKAHENWGRCSAIESCGPSILPVTVRIAALFAWSAHRCRRLWCESEGGGRKLSVQEPVFSSAKLPQSPSSTPRCGPASVEWRRGMWVD